MDIKDYAIAVLNMNSRAKREQAISKLLHGLEHETKWNDAHKKEVQQLIFFLQSDSSEINDLEKYCPVS